MSYEANAKLVLDQMTQDQRDCLLQCVADHVHGFNTCAEVGVKPECASFAVNVAESCGEYDTFPPRALVLAYIVECWPMIYAACTEDHED
jgi:hypothetical protein